MRGGEIDEPIRQRFIRVGMAPSHAALAYRLREIISLLRRDSIPLDYAALARQLHLAQTPSGLRRVRQAWGRSFHAYRPPATGADSATDEQTTPTKDAT
jgi:CRISPR system Cascade subunit CasB